MLVEWGGFEYSAVKWTVFRRLHRFCKTSRMPLLIKRFIKPNTPRNWGSTDYCRTINLFRWLFLVRTLHTVACMWHRCKYRQVPLWEGKRRNSKSKGRDAKTIFVYVIHKDDETIKVVFGQEVTRRKPRMKCGAELLRWLSFGPMDLSLGHVVNSPFGFAIIHLLPGKQVDAGQTKTRSCWVNFSRTNPKSSWDQLTTHNTKTDSWDNESHSPVLLHCLGFCETPEIDFLWCFCKRLSHDPTECSWHLSCSGCRTNSLCRVCSFDRPMLHLNLSTVKNWIVCAI